MNLSKAETGLCSSLQTRCLHVSHAVGLHQRNLFGSKNLKLLVGHLPFLVPGKTLIYFLYIYILYIISSLILMSVLEETTNIPILEVKMKVHRSLEHDRPTGHS